MLSTLALGIGGLSGCLGDSSRSRPDTCEVTQAEDSPLPVSTTTDPDSFVLTYPPPPDGPIMEIRAGRLPSKSNSESPESVGVRVYNETSNPVGVTTTLVKGESSTTEIFQAVCGLEPDEFVAGAVLARDVYSLQARTDTGLGPRSIPIRRDLFGEDVSYVLEVRSDGIRAFASGPG